MGYNVLYETATGKILQGGYTTFTPGEGEASLELISGNVPVGVDFENPPDNMQTHYQITESALVVRGVPLDPDWKIDADNAKATLQSQYGELATDAEKIAFMADRLGLIP